MEKKYQVTKKEECHCGKDGHAIRSINCPVHGKKQCKYCEEETKGDGWMIVENYDKAEAKRYAEHLRHKNN